jgi:hypothetical protein
MHKILLRDALQNVQEHHLPIILPTNVLLFVLRLHPITAMIINVFNHVQQVTMRMILPVFVYYQFIVMTQLMENRHMAIKQFKNVFLFVHLIIMLISDQIKSFVL